MLEAMGSHRGILTTIIFTFKMFPLVVGYRGRKEGDCRQGQRKAAASQAGDTGDLVGAGDERISYLTNRVIRQTIIFI